MEVEFEDILYFLHLFYSSFFVLYILITRVYECANTIPDAREDSDHVGMFRSSL